MILAMLSITLELLRLVNILLLYLLLPFVSLLVPFTLCIIPSSMFSDLAALDLCLFFSCYILFLPLWMSVFVT